MNKQVLPVYSIETLKADVVSAKDLTADHFAHYLDEHRNLHFPHKHSFFHLVYFSKGSGTHSIDFVNFNVQPGHIYFMMPGQVHSWDFASAPDGFIVNFSEQFLHAFIANPRYTDQFSFFSGIAAKQVIDLQPEARKAVEQILTRIVEEANSKRALKDDVVRAALVQLFVTVSRLSFKVTREQSTNYNSLLLTNFQKLIELHYKQKKLTKDYAAMLYVTPNHLNALCKDITGRPAGELIRDRIILEAKRLLVNAQLTVAEISIELGFADNSYFSRFFKKNAGTTPELFRKQIIKK